jgi:hypothetical protein
MVREDLTKRVVDAIGDSEPELVVIDLIDERFDVVTIDGVRYSVNDYYERLGLDEQMRALADDVLPFVSPERDGAFDEAAHVLAARLVGVAPKAHFVLHAAWYTARSADPEVSFYASAPDAVIVRNARLEAHYNALLHAFGDRLHVVEADYDSLVGDPSHKWGLAHYHYVPSYYERIFTQLEEIRAGADLRRPVGALTAPAAKHTGAREPAPRVADVVPGGGVTALRRLRRAVRKLTP